VIRTFSRWAVRTVPATAAIVLAATLPLMAQEGTKNGEWPNYGGDKGSTRYAPLDQINAGNFNKLEVAWRFKTDSLGPRREFQLEATPLMVKGVLYSTAGTRRDVIALDAGTGELIWTHSENEGPRGAAAPRQLSGHGVSYWTDGKEERILYVTPGYRLIALNAKTGQRIPTFGTDGVVDLKQNDDQEMDLVTAEIGLHSTPLVAKNVVIVGAAHLAGGNPKSKTHVKGYVRGFDVKTGKRLWIFHTIPLSGEYGYDTWEKDSASYTGNTGVWAQMSVDENLGLAYLPVELPTGDYYGGHRPGAGLFGESIVAVDINTGKRKWHYQLVHHGIWDMDIPCAPILADITINGKVVKALAQPTKQAFLYVFNRETGEPIWPIVEKPVPQSTVPGEKTSATQPFPSKPPAYDRQGATEDNLMDFTPELHAQVMKLVEKYVHGPIFTPPSVSTVDGTIGSLVSPGPLGGSNWPGGSYDPELHNVYVFSQSVISSFGLVPPRPGQSDMDYIQGNAQAAPRPAAGAAPAAGGPGRGAGGPPGEGGNVLAVQGLPIVKPPYGRISAINLDRGEIVWQVAHGDTPDNVKNSPALKGLNVPRTGRSGIIGVLTTKSLVIAGEAGYATSESGIRGAKLRAYDKLTGKDAGEVFIPAPQSGSPITYMWQGKQYIVLPISGGNYSGEFVAFKLPDTL
jgi:quinoprotein glucose dehydrogenase